MLARTHKHDFIGTEHILLGLLGEPRGLVHKILVAKAGREQAVRDAIESAMPPAGNQSLRGHIPFRTDSRKAIEQASLEATDLGHDWVGTEDTLLGLIRAQGRPAAQIVRNLGFTSEELHATARPKSPKSSPVGTCRTDHHSPRIAHLRTGNAAQKEAESPARTPRSAAVHGRPDRSPPASPRLRIP